MDFFWLLMPITMLTDICFYTNQRVADKVFDHTAHFDYHKVWLPLRVPELMCYFAIVLYKHSYNISWKKMWSRSPKRFV